MSADDEAVAERLGRPARDTGLGRQVRSDALAERGAGEGAGEDADEGDADLDRRQEPARDPRQSSRAARRPAGPVGHGLRRGLRAETTASSDSENSPLRAIRNSAMKNSSTGVTVRDPLHARSGPPLVRDV